MNSRQTMDHTYWHKQTIEKPLFPDLLWSRPENRLHAGKLLIMGGNAQGFAAAAEAYAEAERAGIGTARVLLPDSLQKTVGKVLEAGEYAPSTPSGSFSQRALAELLSHSQWADGVLLAGDLGRNSETAILLEHYIEKWDGQLTFTKDAADYVVTLPGALLVRENTLLVISFAQLQKLAIGARFTRAFTADMALLQLIENLHEFTTRYTINIIVRFHDTLVVAVNGEISTTNIPTEPRIWRLKTAAHAATWWLQNPSKTLKSLTTAVFSEYKATD